MKELIVSSAEKRLEVAAGKDGNSLLPKWEKNLLKMKKGYDAGTVEKEHYKLFEYEYKMRLEFVKAAFAVAKRYDSGAVIMQKYPGYPMSVAVRISVPQGKDKNKLIEKLVPTLSSKLGYKFKPAKPDVHVHGQIYVARSNPVKHTGLSIRTHYAIKSRGSNIDIICN